MGIPVEGLWDDYDVALRARKRSENTRKIYRRSFDRLLAWLAESGRSTDIDTIDHQTLNRFFVDVSERLSGTSVAMDYRSLRAFFNWAVAEDELDRSPFAKMSIPSVEDVPPDVIPQGDLVKLLAGVERSDFFSRRDRAIILLFVDTGVRVGEMTGLEVGDVDRERQLATVTGKGNRTRVVPFGDTTNEALTRYLRARRGHTLADRPEMWLGRQSAFGAYGIPQMLNRRCAQVGIDPINPHRFRHTFADQWLASGGREGDLKQLGGWRSDAMVHRYGRARSAARAIDAHRDLSPADRLGRR